MHMPITISMASVSFPKSEILSHLSKTSHSCGTAIMRMAANVTRVRNRRYTSEFYITGAVKRSDVLVCWLTGRCGPLWRSYPGTAT